MTSAPTERSTELDLPLLERWALSYLGRYSSSAANLHRVLMRRVRRHIGTEDRERLRTADTLIAALVQRYRETRLLDDAAYAAARARRAVTRGRSPAQIVAGLAAKGIEGAVSGAAIAALRDGGGDPELLAAVALARRRQFGPFRTAPPTDPAKQRGRELAAFARAGFSRSIATAVLACIDPDAVAALLSAGAG